MSFINSIFAPRVWTKNGSALSASSFTGLKVCAFALCALALQGCSVFGEKRLGDFVYKPQTYEYCSIEHKAPTWYQERQAQGDRVAQLKVKKFTGVDTEITYLLKNEIALQLHSEIKHEVLQKTAWGKDEELTQRSQVFSRVAVPPIRHQVFYIGDCVVGYAAVKQEHIDITKESKARSEADETKDWEELRSKPFWALTVRDYAAHIQRWPFGIYRTQALIYILEINPDFPLDDFDRRRVEELKKGF